MLCLIACLLLSDPAAANLSAGPPAGQRPNVVIILADDLGWGDVKPLNPDSPIPTPAFERLAAAGMTLTNGHTSAAVCTPTRYSLLCGRHCWRTRLKSGVLGGYSAPLIEPDRETIATIANRAGYRTAAVGKWHLGLGWQLRTRVDGLDDFQDPPARGQVDFSQPIAGGLAGFGTTFLVPASLDMSPYVFVADGRATGLPTLDKPAVPFPAFSRAGERAQDFEIIDVLDRIVDEATTAIREAAVAEEPLLLYVPLTSPHKPIAVHPRFEGRSGIGPYGDFVVQTDDAIGRIVAATVAAGMQDNTLLIVTSDNGSYMRSTTGRPGHSDDATQQAYDADVHRPNGPFRGTKADLYEAGHRVPFFAVWPGVIEPGSSSDLPVTQVDLLATLADIWSVPYDAASAVDSVSMLPLLAGESNDSRPIVVQSANGSLGLIDGNWKLLATDGSGGRLKPRGRPWSEPYQLYDLADDPGESIDLSGRYPERVAAMTAALRQVVGQDAVAGLESR